MSFNNPLQAPNVNVPIIGNIPTIPLISARDFFLQAMESWVATPTMSSQFVVLFEGFPSALNQQWAQENEYNANDGWNIDSTKRAIANPLLQKTIGCIFAQGFRIPGAHAQHQAVHGIRGFYGGRLIQSRILPDTLQLDFLETNTSFTDSLLLPWVHLVSHKGMIARKPSESIKTNIVIMQYTRSESFLSQVPRKIWTFYGACPTRTPEKSYNYKQEEVEVKTGIEFIYNHYNVKFNQFLPLFSLVSKFASGGAKELTNTIIAGDSLKAARNAI